MSPAKDQQPEFELLRPCLMGLAYRMLGTRADAEDAIQETWVRWQNQKIPPDNTKAWLTRVCTNLCIDTLRRLKQERNLYPGPWLPEPVDPEHVDGFSSDELIHSLQLAYILLLERLTPSERASFLLHDVFGYEFREVADILDIGIPAARQQASRARKHLRASKTRFDVSTDELKKLGTRLYAAIAEGDIGGMLEYMAKDIELWADGGGKALAARNVVRGPGRVAAFLAGVYRKTPTGTRLEFATVNGKPSALLYDNSQCLVALLTITCNESGKIDRVLAHRNPEKLAGPLSEPRRV